MPLVRTITDLTCRQTALAKAMGLTQARIGQLIDEGIMIKDANSKSSAVFLFESVKNYYSNKSGYSDDEVNYSREKALYMRAKRETAELKLSKIRGQLYEAATVENAFVNLLTILRNNLQAIPSKYAMQLEGKSHNEIYRLLTDEIDYNLSQIANFDITSLEAEVADEDI